MRTLAVLVLGLPVAAAAGDWQWAGSVATGYDTNPGNSSHPGNMRPVGTAYASIGASRERRFSLFTAVEWQGALAGEQVFELERLSSVTAAIRLRLLHKPGHGFYTPVLAAWSSAGARDSLSRPRDGVEMRAGASAAMSLTTAIALRIEAVGWRREAAGMAFDNAAISCAVNLDWRVSSATLYGNARFTDGDLVVSSRGDGDIELKREHSYLEREADAIDRDTAFGADWWAFRLEGRTQVGTLGINLPIATNIALDAQAQYAVSRTSDFVYERWLGSLGLLFRW